jgi:hypothetical protein
MGYTEKPIYGIMQIRFIINQYEALHYKPEVRGFNFQWGHWDFSLN